jgi:osomolarity two-component system sensor histidine kinase SLN1
MTDSKNQISQQLSLDEKEFRLRDIGSQVLAIFDKQAKEGGIKLSVKFECLYDVNLNNDNQTNERGDIGSIGSERLKDMLLYGDENRILQVVMNLVSNSLKFTPAGGSVTITIRCIGEANISHSQISSVQSRHRSKSDPIQKISEKNSDQQKMVPNRALTPSREQWLSFEFEVEDTGPGIPVHLHSKIFEPFVQGDLGLNKQYGGAGLGLSICSQIAGLMKGTIGLKSEAEQGSVFVLSIPLKHVISHADDTVVSTVHLPITASLGGSVSIDERG